MNPYLNALHNYAVFHGRASRPSFWLALLLAYVLALIAYFLDQAVGTASRGGGGLLVDLFALANVIPVISLAVRRMHDTDRSGWWLLLPPVAFVFALMAGTPAPNRFGALPARPTPRARRAAASLITPTAVPLARPQDLVGEIERLAQLKAEGHLSEAEFEVMKAKSLTQKPRIARVGGCRTGWQRA